MGADHLNRQAAKRFFRVRDRRGKVVVDLDTEGIVKSTRCRGSKPCRVFRRGLTGGILGLPWRAMR